MGGFVFWQLGSEVPSTIGGWRGRPDMWEEKSRSFLASVVSSLDFSFRQQMLEEHWFPIGVGIFFF